MSHFNRQKKGPIRQWEIVLKKHESISLFLICYLLQGLWASPCVATSPGNVTPQFEKEAHCIALAIEGVIAHKTEAETSVRDKYERETANLKRTEGPLAVVISQTMDGWEQASRREKMGDLNLPDSHYDQIERDLQKQGVNVNAREMQHNKLYWRQQPGEFTHLLIYRTSADGADIRGVSYFNGNAVIPENELGKVTRTEANQMVHSLENQLYLQYHSQGGFDAKEEQEYRLQDMKRSNYTTHFVIYTDSRKSGLRLSYIVENLSPTDAATPVTDKKVAHLQLLVSDTLKNPINSESNLTEDSGKNPLDRKEGETWGDLGRALNVLESQLSEATQAHLKLADLARPDRFSVLVQDAIGWGIHYANLDKLVFQCNDTVLLKMKAILGKENITNVRPYEGKSSEKSEWYAHLNTVVLDRQQMKHAEEHMFAEEMTARLQATLDRFGEAKAQWNTDVFNITLQPSVLNYELYDKLLFQPLIANRKKYESFQSVLHFGQRPEGEQLTIHMGPDLQALKDAITFLKPYL